jgi:hypothetical protein
MNRQYHLKTVFLGAAILLLFAYVGGILIARERLSELRNELMLQVSEQQTLLGAIAETTARNGADEVTEQIVKDCSVDERAEFDALLGRLDAGLIRAELTALERLFGRCGSFYAERKSVMVARLEREVEVYDRYVRQLQQIGGADIEVYQVTLWKQLVEDEKAQSKEFSLLVANQDKIISALLEGKTASSPELKVILEETKKIQQALGDANTRAAEKRRELSAL